ncbi:MAG: chitobiase/beta-hexosaminidase C-terminal domain-containing protein, partial [Actinobacteria bacterium]|nr:chitobiase/beta-hexosaminidase C-terminal domain-containing protein [Actinomycetota bacterium]
DSSDWLEIHNPDPEPRSLAGYALSDDPAVPRKWVLPSVTVPANGELLVWMSGKRRDVMPPGAIEKSRHIPFERIFIAPGGQWRYLLAPSPVIEPPDGWTTPAFDDSEWAVGPSGFGYGDGDDATEVPQGTIAILVRRIFTIDRLADVNRLVLEIDYDDGFVAYLNGSKVTSVNSPDEHPGFQSIATSKHDHGSPERFDLTPHIDHLVEGKNVLAIAGLNDSPSTDMSLIPALGTLPLFVHASFRLSRAGGSIVLSGPDGKLVDRLDYPRQEPDQPFGRSFSDGGEIGVLLTPTPGRRNGRVSVPNAITATVTFEPAPGRYEGPTEVRLALDAPAEGLVLHYTTHGAAPTAADPRAGGPIAVAGNTVIRAAGFLGEERATPVSSA